MPESVMGQVVTLLPSRALDRDAIAEGARLLQQADAVSRAAVVSRPVPLVFYEMPSTLKAADFEPRKMLFVSWGWDLAFGGSLTVTAMYERMGTIGRAYVAGDDPTLSDFRGGRFVCICMKNGAAAVALDVDLCGTEAARAEFDENWDRAATHKALATDSRARFWEAIGGIARNNQNLKPREQLSLGWVKRYGEAVEKLYGHLEIFRREYKWPKEATLPAPWTQWAALFASGEDFTVDALLARVKTLHENSFERLLELHGGVAWHEAIHAVFNDHSPLCNIMTMALDAYLLSAERTLCGRRVPMLRGRDLEYHAIDPDGFSPGIALDYWKRVLKVPVEWGSLAKATDVPVDLTPGSAVVDTIPRAEDKDAALEAANALIKEAISERKWAIPPGALLELNYGPFTQLELREQGSIVEFLLRTDLGEFSAGGINLSDEHVWWEGLTNDSEEVDARMPLMAGLDLVLAAVIRDFLVVEQRERVFHHGTAPRKLQQGSDSDGPRVVYLPRVSYVGHADIPKCRQELDHASREARAHAVRPHLRRAEVASPAQLFIARRYGVDVPKGYTFVRPHERGKKPRDVVYRSRSALQCLFRVRGPTASAGARDGWFQFERDVQGLMARLGFNVEHVSASRRGDRGVDVYATKGTDLEQVAWVIQCKAFAPRHKVGPNIARELVGTLAEYPQGTRGMIVTTSSFSEETIKLATRHNVRLMHGEEFGRLLQQALATE
jgi:Holliday junction resolvase